MNAVEYQIHAYMLPLNEHFTGNIQNKNFTEIMEKVENMIQYFTTTSDDIESITDENFEILFMYKMISLNTYRSTLYFSDSLEGINRDQFQFYKNQPQFSILKDGLKMMYKTFYDSVNLLKNHDSISKISQYSGFDDWLTMRTKLEFCVLATFFIYKKDLKISNEKVIDLANYSIYIAQQFAFSTQKLKQSDYES